MTRNEFCDFVLNEFSHSWNAVNFVDGSPLWIPEERDGWKASYFAVLPVINELRVLGAGHKHYFWEWCKDNLSKVPMCYMTNHLANQEWWGFNTEEDMTWFIVKWT